MANRTTKRWWARELKRRAELKQAETEQEREARDHRPGGFSPATMEVAPAKPGQLLRLVQDQR